MHFFIKRPKNFKAPKRNLILSFPEAEESCEEEEEEGVEEEEKEGGRGDTAKQKQIFIQELLLAALSLGNSLDEQDGCQS